MERLLEEDIRNNSAWNQRFFIVTTFPIKEVPPMEEKLNKRSNIRLSGEILERELNFTLNAIKKVTRNESAWNYLRG